MACSSAVSLAESQTQLCDTSYGITESVRVRQNILQVRTVGMPLLQAVSYTLGVAGGYSAFREEGIQYFPYDAVVIACHGAPQGEGFENYAVVTCRFFCQRKHDITDADDIPQVGTVTQPGNLPA